MCGMHHVVALGAGNGDAISQEHDPLGLEDTREEHGLPQCTLLGTGSTRLGLGHGWL